MFSIQELKLFHTNYFTHFSYSNGVIEVQSINTGHWWRITKKDMPRATMIIVHHKYRYKDKYHIQCHVHTFYKAFRLIKEHDTYILNKNSSHFPNLT